MSQHFLHSVYFWLKEDLTPAQKNTFVQGLESLKGIETVKNGYIGVPASTDRPIIDRSYSYALVLAFDNKTDHDTYQDHPVHDAFRDSCGEFWSKVQIYDSVSE